MSFAAGVRQTCRRSFATAASPAKPNPNPNPSVKALVNILDSQSERQQARQDSLAAKSDSLRSSSIQPFSLFLCSFLFLEYHSFQVDQVHCVLFPSFLLLYLFSSSSNPTRCPSSLAPAPVRHIRVSVLPQHLPSRVKKTYFTNSTLILVDSPTTQLFSVIS